MLAKHSSETAVLSSKNITRRLTWSEDVWQCLTVFECVPPWLTWVAQPSTLILCRRHHWWSRTFCCPVASDICINSTGVDTSRETLRLVPRWKCDMWPQTCSTGVLMSSDELWSYWSVMHIYAWLCMHHAPSLASSLPTIWPSVTLWSAEESTTEPKAESTRGSATVLVSSAGAGANSAAKGAECISGKLNAPCVKQAWRFFRKFSGSTWLD